MKFKLKSKADVKRYQNKKYVVKEESLADHVWYMNEIAYRLTTLIEFDIREVIFRIAIHDMGESVSLDIPRDVKYYSSEFREILNDIEESLLRSSGVMTKDLIDLSKSAKSHDTLEGAIVHFCDVYQAYLKLKDEVELLGNNSLKDELYKECTPYIESVIETVIKKYPQCEPLRHLL